MKNLYILEEINEEEFYKLKNEDADFIAFDYISHKTLAKKNIQHNLIDDYIDDAERKEMFQLCSNFLKEYEISNQSIIKFHNIDLVSIIDRNELHEFLMDKIPKIKVIRKLIKNNSYEKFFVSSDIYEIFSKTEFSSNFEILNNTNKNQLTLEKIDIPIKLGNIETKFTVSREKYKILKTNLEKTIGSLFSLRKSSKEKKKIILIEFDPETYFDLLQEIDRHNLQPVLVNFRKSPIYSLNAVNCLKKSNSLVINPEQFIEKSELLKLNQIKSSIKKILKGILENGESIVEFSYEESNFNLILQEKIINILIQRLDEYLIEILIAESVKNMQDVKGIITLNFSGETEKIFSKIQNKIPIILLQHAFANYIKSISHFDILDDYHLIKNKIAVWGEIVKNYLVNVRKIPENQIILSGSPKYDSYFNSIKNTSSKKIILVTLRPIINHMEGPRITLYEKYEKVLQDLIQISNILDNVEIIFKLHPQQNVNNEIITNMIKTNKKIKILQFNPVKELLSNCVLHVNIAPDNFDASSVVLEAMILGKPTLNIQLQKNEIEFEFIKDNAIKSITFDSDIKNAVLDLLDNQKTDKLIKNSQEYLNKYMKNIGSASKTLIDSI